jgi:twitching motility protein PilT
MDIRELLQFMVQQNISDIHFKADCAPLIRLNGQLISSQKEMFTPEAVKQIAYSLMSEVHKKRFEEEGELDLSYALDKVSRFRVNVYRQKGTLALSLRVIPWELKSFADLHLPTQTLQKLCAMPSGLILIAGVTGAGKTTTLNAMINYLNQNFAYNIITIEDPIEYYHKDKKSSISQREVGNDTQSFGSALKYILRQDPDVIVIGEMRDPEAVAAAVVAAETGHLVLSTIHTMDTVHTIQRIVDSYPPAQQAPMRQAVANILRGVIAQKLIATDDGQSRMPCTEVLQMTPYIRQLVADNKTADVYSAIARGQNDGMMTFDQDLLRLCKEGRISKETALVETTRPDNFLSMLQGISVKV